MMGWFQTENYYLKKKLGFFVCPAAQGTVQDEDLREGQLRRPDPRADGRL